MEREESKAEKSGVAVRPKGLAGWEIALISAGIVVALSLGALLTVVIMHQRALYGPTPEQIAIAKQVEGKSPAEVEALVMQLLSDGKQKDAEAIAENLPKKFRGDLRVTFLQGVLGRSRWRNKEASALFFSKVRQIDPDSPEGKASQLIMDIDQGMYYDRNLKEFGELVERQPEDMMITWLYAMACREYYKRTESGKYSSAGIKAYERLGEYWEVGPSLFHQTYGNVLAEAGRNKDAVVHYQKAAELEPATWTYEALGHTLRRLKRYDESIEAYKAVLAIDPEDSGAINGWGVSLELQKKYVEAAEKYAEGAALDNSWSLNNLGLFYRDGLGVKKDLDKAFYYIAKSAESGNRTGMSHLAGLYKKGTGVERNLAKAEEWYLKAAQAGHSSAYFDLGFMFDPRKNHKDGDAQKALEYYEQAAKQGSGGAAINAALICRFGCGMETNYVQSMRFFLLSAELGWNMKETAPYVAQHYLNGLGTDRDPVKAVEWLRKGVKLNDEYSIVELANCYVRGDGVERDLKLAVEMYRKVAEKKPTARKYMLLANGLRYLEQNEEALEPYRKALALEPSDELHRLLGDTLGGLGRDDEAKEEYAAAVAMNPGHADAINNWGLALERQERYAEAAEKYQEAAALGNNWSYHNLALFYEKGLGLDRNPEKAREFYEISAEKGNTRAIASLGRLYVDGAGGEKDLEKGLELLRKAAEAGEATAFSKLAWVLATTSVEEQLNPQEAVRYAEKLSLDSCENATVIAAAYARDGQFEKAIEVERKALDVLKMQRGELWDKDASLREKERKPYEERLRLYEAGKPYTQQ